MSETELKFTYPQRKQSSGLLIVIGLFAIAVMAFVNFVSRDMIEKQRATTNWPGYWPGVSSGWRAGPFPKDHAEVNVLANQAECCGRCGGTSWSSIVRAVETAHGGRRKEFRDRHGDWGRDWALYWGRRHGRLRLRELGELAGGIGYTAVAQAVSRTGELVALDRQWQRHFNNVRAQLSYLKMGDPNVPLKSGSSRTHC